MQYLYQNPIPLPWLLADSLTVMVTLFIVIFVVQKSKHAVISLVHIALLCCIVVAGKRASVTKVETRYDP